MLLDGKVLGFIHDDLIASAVEKLRKCKVGLDGPVSDKGVPQVSECTHTSSSYFLSLFNIAALYCSDLLSNCTELKPYEINFWSNNACGVHYR